MYNVVFQQTFSAAPLNLISGIGDMLLTQIGARLMLYTSTRAGGGLLALDVTGDTMLLSAQVALAAQNQLSAVPTLDLYQVAGQQRLITSGLAETSLRAQALTASGTFGAVQRPAGGPSGVVTAQTLLTLGSTQMIYMARSGDASVLGYRIAADGAMTIAVDYAPMNDQNGVNISSLLAFRVGGQQFLAATYVTSDQVLLMRVAANGSLQTASSLGVSNGLGIVDPGSLRSFDLLGQSYLLMASGPSHALTLLSVQEDGSLRLADHLIDTLDTRLQAVLVAEVISINGRAFVVAGGGDGGLHLFEVVPGGRLIMMATALQQTGAALDNITALALRATASGIEIFVGSEGSGITRLLVEIGVPPAPLQGGEAADDLRGGAGHDLILGNAGDDQLRGNAGDDILIGGAGRDQLWGGAGADVFVLAADGQVDQIMDYQPGIDRIDITAWGRIYSLSALTVQTTATGAILQYGASQVVIVAANGLPLSRNDFAAAGMFALWHADYGLSLPGGVITGTPRSDYLFGSESHDIFEISAGQDTIDGDLGTDRLDFSRAETAASVNLTTGRGLAGSALGQIYISIEDVTGSRFGDQLTGHDGANLLQGGAGNDTLIGRGGDDRLEGGAGDDLLNGGAGADSYYGGDGVDLAYYWEHASGLTVDMLFPTSGTGEAFGDRFDGVENIAGSNFSDNLRGDQLANRISGMAGNDMIYGRGGDDVLDGGAGDDLFSGGPGADLFMGGPGMDLVFYWEVTSAITVDMLIGANSSGEAVGDRFFEIEGVAGSNFSDILRGDQLPNMINGMAGNDTLYGRDGDDTLDGGAGDDMFNGGAGADLFFGGAGNDMVFYWELNAGIWVDMLNPSFGTGEAAGDRFSAIENIGGTNFADNIRGDGQANVLMGMAGNDAILGHVDKWRSHSLMQATSTKPRKLTAVLS